MNKLKLSVITLTATIIIILVAATIMESIKGTPFTSENIYTTTWFVLLWAALVISATCYIVMRKLYGNVCVFLIHVSFVVILLGALASWLTSESGSIHLRNNESTNIMKSSDGEPEELGFNVKLDNFNVVNYPGTDAPMDYVTNLSVNNEQITVSMNNIGNYRSFRFIQSGYDSDMNGTTLSVYHDPWGITVTYIGYALLFCSLILSMFNKKTKIRSLYKKALSLQSVKTLLLGLLLISPFFAAQGTTQERIKINSDIANDFGKICALYNSRITPINTIAVNFVTKMSGKSSWNGMSANEVFAGWVFDIPYWETVKMIEIKDKKAQELLGINGKWASFTDFWNEYNEYKLEKPLKEATKNGDKKLQKQLRDADEKFNIIRMLYGGEMLKIFPYTNKQGNIQWFAPGQPLGNIKMDEKELKFVRKSMDYLAESIITGDNERAIEIAKKIYSYQHVRAKAVVPTKFAIYSEIFYNKLNTTHWLTIMYLVFSLLIIITTLKSSYRFSHISAVAGKVLILLMLVHTTILLALRWYISNHLPMSNGFETMQFMSWATLILTILFSKRFEPVKIFGPLLSAFALLVAMITDGNPQITPLMPVLQSPLLSVHVMVIMFSYALFGLMALISIQAIFANRKGELEKVDKLAALSQFMLYPAVSLLAIGIFIGAIWANVSWGRYWSWDSKETWALITMLIYCAPLHSDIKWFRTPLNIHIYMLLAFLSVLMTYFGANYFLAGMHSYA